MTPRNRDVNGEAEPENLASQSVREIFAAARDGISKSGTAATLA
jgi:hypothetical protein